MLSVFGANVHTCVLQRQSRWCRHAGSYNGGDVKVHSCVECCADSWSVDASF